MTILKIGSRGSAVKVLQRDLNELGANPRLVEDGEFGQKTDSAVKDFQSNFGLVPDGLVGVQTSTAIRQATTGPIKPRHPEPDKSSMLGPIPPTEDGSMKPSAPPNVDSLELLFTSRSIRELIWHCAATTDGKDYTVSDIRAWHKARGFTDVGYHYVVYRDGRVMLGRPIGQVGAHVEGYNAGTVGCCYVGGVAADGKKAKDTRTPQQRSSMLWLTQQLLAKFPITRVSGHNQYAAKACPSFDVRRDPLGNMA